LHTGITRFPLYGSDPDDDVVVDDALLKAATRRINRALPRWTRLTGYVGAAAPRWSLRSDEAAEPGAWICAGMRFRGLFGARSLRGIGAGVSADLVLRSVMLEAQSLVWNQNGCVWPSRSGKSPSRRAEGPSATHLAFGGDEMRMWFGEEAEPVLELEPIRLRDGRVAGS
jgi:hypothetical protein